MVGAAMMLTTREVILLGLIDAVRAEDAGSEPAYLAMARLFDYAQHVRDVENVPDPMPAGWNRPAPASKYEVTSALTDALQRVRAGDSFEGFIQWTMPTDEPELEGAEFGLMARYRVGNLDGQGGMRVYSKGEPT